MTIANSQVIAFSPSGLSDNVDGLDSPPGACVVLQNLIPDPAARNVWTCRPAAGLLSAMAGPVIILKIVGSYVFGLFSSVVYSGFDEPFCFDLKANSFVPISGVTGAGVLPITQPTALDWSPPTIDQIGVNLVVTHPGFNGAPNFFGWFDLSNITLPVWHAGNTTGVLLTTPPSWVVQFGERAYFGVNPTVGQPAVVATDVLLLHITNATQVLSFGDNLPLTAAKGLPLHNQLGGIVQSLIVFKSVSNIYQVTGDFALNSSAINTLNVATGTSSPASICATPDGLAFLAPDGYRFIGQDGTVSPPIGAAGMGVVVPFVRSLTPTRVVAACNAFILRVSVKPFYNPGTPWQEYWYDLIRKVWSGPHTCATQAVDAEGDLFIVALRGATGLYASPVQVEGATSTVEAGVQLNYVMQTTVIPDANAMAYCELNYLTIDMGFPAGFLAGSTKISVIAEDQNQEPIAQSVYSNTNVSSAWGGFLWGQKSWSGVGAGLFPRYIPFKAPLVYRRVAMRLTGNSVEGLRIGKFFMRRVILNYDVVN